MYSKKRSYYRSFGRTKSSSLAKRTAGQFKSARKGNDSLSFVVNTTHTFTVMYDHTTETGTAALNIWEVLANNGQFFSLKSMYDQVRVDGIQVKLNVVNALVDLNNLQAVNNYTIWTAWDKTGLSIDETRLIENYDTNKYVDNNDPNETLEGYRTNIGSRIVNKTGAEKSILNSFQRWGKFTSCYPQLNYEKSQYVQTGDIAKTIEQMRNDNGAIRFAAKQAGNSYNQISSSGFWKQ